MKFIPVLPPTAASTDAIKVVGILIVRMPRLKVAPAKPPISVIIPPPKFTSKELREAPSFDKAVHIWANETKPLFISPASITRIGAF